MRKLLTNFMIMILLCAGLLVVQTLLWFAFTKWWDFSILQSSFFWSVYGIAVLIGLGLTIYRWFSVWEGKRVLKVNDGLEESRWLTTDDVLVNENLTLTTLKKVSKFDGIPIYAREKGKNDLDIVLAKQTHALIIGIFRTRN